MRQNFEKFFVTPQPVFIIGTYDKDGNPDAMNAAWAGQIAGDKIGIALSSHKTTDNLRETREFTVSFATKAQVTASDYVGIASANKVPDKIQKTGWTVKKAEHVNAPYFEELPVTLECRVDDIVSEFGENRIIATVVNMSADESVLTDGKVDLDKLQPIIFDSSALAYRTAGEKVGGAWNAGKALM